MSGDPARPPDSRWATQVLPRLAFYPFLAASLLVFPSGLPWLILAWLLLFAVQKRRGKSGALILGLGAGLVIFKRPDPAPALLVLVGLMSVAAVLEQLRQRQPSLEKASRAAGWLLVPAWLLMTWQWTQATHTERRPTFDPGRPVVVLGDSLSSGGLVRVLGKRFRAPVVDLARGGITAKEGLAFFGDVLAQKPQAVVIEIGGHDSIRGNSRASTKESIRSMIRQSREAGAEVFLFEIPRGFVSDPFWGLDRDLAREFDLELIPDGAIRQLVIFSPFTPLGKWTGRQLSYDGLHPNDAGNVFLADQVEAALLRVYGPALLH